MPRDDRARWGQSTHTRAVVSFHTDEPGGFDSDLIDSHPAFGKIIGVSTEKTLDGVSGSFTIVVKKPPNTDAGMRSWRNLWRDPEQVWVRIKFLVDGQTVDTMFGQIDSVSESTSRMGGGSRDETFTITGRDFGKVFETTELFTNFFANGGSDPILQQSALTRTGLDNQAGTPAHFVRFLVETWLANNGIGDAQWLLPQSLGGDVFASLLNLTTIEPMTRNYNGYAFHPSLINLEGSAGRKLWDSMTELAHGLLNEMWVDLAPPPAGYGDSGESALDGLAPSVYLRERRFPFRSDDNRHTSHSLWDSTRTRVLTRGDVNGRQLARGGASHRYNYWQLDPIGLTSQDYGNSFLLQRGIEGVSPGMPGNNPIFSTPSVQYHGVRRYFQTTRFLPLREANEADTELWVRKAARWLKLLHDWYSVAPFELSGSLKTTRIMPEIRVGERVREERDEGDIIYYVEGVRNEWRYPQAGSTTLTVTRGEYEDDDLLDYVYEQYEEGTHLTARERCFISEDGTTDELIDALRRGCTFEAPSAGNVLGFDIRGDQVQEVEDIGGGFEVNGQRTLVEELDSESIDLSADNRDPAMTQRTQRSDSAVTNDGDLPEPDAQPVEAPGEPGLSRNQLESGEPIDNGQDFVLADDDPIGGLNLTGEER